MPLTADEVFAMGEEQVARIKGEMDNLRASSGAKMLSKATLEALWTQAGKAGKAPQSEAEWASFVKADISLKQFMEVGA